MPFAFHSYVIRMSIVCRTYITRMCSYVICMYLYVIRMSLVCTRMSPACHSYVLVCNGVSLVCVRMPSLCYSYVLVYHPYVTLMWFYHGPSETKSQCLSVTAFILKTLYNNVRNITSKLHHSHTCHHLKV